MLSRIPMDHVIKPLLCARIPMASASSETMPGTEAGFRLGAMLKEARKEANLTQEQLAERTGTKKSYISRIERGLSDIQMSTYYKLIELGLGKHLNIEIA